MVQYIQSILTTNYLSGIIAIIKTILQNDPYQTIEHQQMLF